LRASYIIAKKHRIDSVPQVGVAGNKFRHWSVIYQVTFYQKYTINKIG